MIKYLFSLLLISCVIENDVYEERPLLPAPDSIHESPTLDAMGRPVEPPPPPKLDVLLVIDNSCSMQDDFPQIQYGLTIIPGKLNEHGFDWRMAITSAGPSEGIFYEVPHSSDPNWDTAGLIGQLRNEAGGFEQGMDSALAALISQTGFFRPDTTDLIIFVSDERDSSTATVERFRTLWPEPFFVASICGPPEIDYSVFRPCAAGPNPKYHELSSIYVDVCSNAPFDIIGELVPFL